MGIREKAEGTAGSAKVSRDVSCVHIPTTPSAGLFPGLPTRRKVRLQRDEATCLKAATQLMQWMPEHPTAGERRGDPQVLVPTSTAPAWQHQGWERKESPRNACGV
nr:uncharacterized protein LOC129144030 [Pan troglodytes]